MNFGNKSCTYPEQHELVEWVVPLHQENVGWRCSTHVHVIITRTGYNTATIAALCVGHLSRYGKSPKISHTQVTRISNNPTLNSDKAVKDKNDKG